MNNMFYDKQLNIFTELAHKKPRGFNIDKLDDTAFIEQHQQDIIEK